MRKKVLGSLLTVGAGIAAACLVKPLKEKREEAEIEAEENRQERAVRTF